MLLIANVRKCVYEMVKFRYNQQRRKVARHFRLPSNRDYKVSQPCRATEHTHACWQLQCNPSRIRWGPRKAAQCLKTLGPIAAVQRYSARVVFWCDAEVIPTAGRTHRFCTAFLRRLEDELADLSDRSFPRFWLNRYSRESGDVAFNARGQVIAMRCRGKGKY